MIQAKILSRDLSETILFVENQIHVDQLTISLMGGLINGTLKLPLQKNNEEFLGLIGKFVEFIDTDDQEKWIGIITEISIPYGSVSLRASMDDLFNSIKVVSSKGIQTIQTDWLENSISIATYGKKQRILGVSEKTLDEANLIASKYLSMHDSVFVGVDLSASKDITLKVTGLFLTLDWIYYANSKGWEGYTETGSGGREIGEDDRPKLAQKIHLDSDEGWDARKIKIRPWKYPSSNPPTDNLIVRLCSDNSGTPGSELANAVFSAEEIDTNSDWLEKDLSSSVSLDPDLDYWITVERSGSVDKTKYFMVDTNINAGYERGDLWLYFTKNSSWSNSEAGKWGDLNFELIGMSTIQDQISNIVSTCGQYLQGTIFLNPMEEETEIFRDGFNTALYELKNLLKLASSHAIAYISSDLQLICKILSNEPTDLNEFCFLRENGITRFHSEFWNRPKFGFYKLENSPLFPSFLPIEIEYSSGNWRISQIAGVEYIYNLGEIL